VWLVRECESSRCLRMRNKRYRILILYTAVAPLSNQPHQLNKIYGSLHHPGHSGANPDGATLMINNATTEFHIYTTEWNSSTIKFYVDNQLYYTFTNNSTLPFNQNFFIIMNCAMGGNFGGTVDPSFTSATFEIDYVRVYQ